VLVLDSSLLGNYQKYDSPTLLPMLPGIKPEAEKMLGWLAAEPKPAKGEVMSSLPRSIFHCTGTQVFPMQDLIGP
jgi:hypothetical protein